MALILWYMGDVLAKSTHRPVRNIEPKRTLSKVPHPYESGRQSNSNIYDALYVARKYHVGESFSKLKPLISNQSKYHREQKWNKNTKYHKDRP